MKTMKNISMIIVFIVSVLNFQLSVGAECPPCDYSKALLGITPENSRFLWYFHFFNVFDSVDVEATYGEFQIVRNNEMRKVNFKIDQFFESNNWRILGQEEVGEDRILSGVARTEPFVYDSASKLQFFRLLTAGISCSATPPIDTNANKIQDAPFWVGYVGVVLDTSEWVVQLMDKETERVLASLDSVGISTNYNSPYANVYGTNPRITKVEVDLPDEFAGREVYLRISTRRYGPTPLGMWVYVTPSKFSLSTFYDYNNGECIIPWAKCAFDYTDFEVYYLGKLIEYLDSLVASQNRPLRFEDLPSDRRWLGVHSHLLDSLYSRYFDKFFINDTNYVWIERGSGQNYRKCENLNKFSGLNEVGKLDVFYNEISKCILLKSTHNISNCKVKIYNLSGRKIWESKNYDIVKGENTICLPKIAPQVLVLQIQKDDYSTLLVTKIPAY